MAEEALLLSSILKKPLVGLIPIFVSLSLLALSSLRRLLLRAAPGGGDCLRHRLDSRCAVCLDDIVCDEDKFRVLPECGHGFHEECVDRWLKCRRICPLCRTKVERERPSRRDRLLAAVLSGFCRWMDSRFDSELTLVFCQNL